MQGPGGESAGGASPWQGEKRKEKRGDEKDGYQGLSTLYSHRSLTTFKERGQRVRFRWGAALSENAKTGSGALEFIVSRELEYAFLGKVSSRNRRNRE